LLHDKTINKTKKRNQKSTLPPTNENFCWSFFGFFRKKKDKNLQKTKRENQRKKAQKKKEKKKKKLNGNDKMSIKQSKHLFDFSNIKSTGTIL